MKNLFHIYFMKSVLVYFTCPFHADI